MEAACSENAPDLFDKEQNRTQKGEEEGMGGEENGGNYSMLHGEALQWKNSHELIIISVIS